MTSNYKTTVSNGTRLHKVTNGINWRIPKQTHTDMSYQILLRGPADQWPSSNFPDRTRKTTTATKTKKGPLDVRTNLKQ